MPHVPSELGPKPLTQATGNLRDRMANAALNASERLMLLIDISGSMGEAIPDNTLKRAGF